MFVFPHAVSWRWLWTRYQMVRRTYLWWCTWHCSEAWRGYYWLMFSQSRMQTPSWNCRWTGKTYSPDFTATCIHHNTQWRLLLIWLKNCQVGPKGSKYMHTDCILPIVDYFTVKIFRAASCRFSILHMYIVTSRTYPTLYVRYWPVS